MTTRHAEPGSPLNQGRFMSDPLFAESRGVYGHLVAEKARLMSSARCRELIFFLQAESLQPGGLARVARELLDMFPERLGTPTMHELGMKPGTIYRGKALRDIHYEMCYSRNGGGPDLLWILRDQAGEFNSDEYKASVQECSAECREGYLAVGERFLSDLCLDPGLHFAAPGEAKQTVKHNTVRELLNNDTIQQKYEGFGAEAGSEFRYFHDIIPTLFAYKQRKETEAFSKLAETTISQQVFSTLNFAAATRGMVLIEGNARIGKTTAAAAWCSANTGRARFVSLVDAPDEGCFYRAIARSLGLPCTYTRKVNEMRDRANDMLQKSGIMLVLDEAHYLFPQHSRAYTVPHRVNWIMTALCNQRIPVALVTTPQFVRSQRKIERQTGWTSEQFRGRLKRFVSLQSDLPQVELEAVARFHLPEASSATIKMLAGHAMATTTSISGIVNAIDSARYEAAQRGSDSVTFEDVETAISSSVIPSDQAMTLAYNGENRPASGRRNARVHVAETPLQSSCTDPATDLQRPLTRVMSPRGRDESEDIGGRLGAGHRPAVRRGQLVPA